MVMVVGAIIITIRHNDAAGKRNEYGTQGQQRKAEAHRYSSLFLAVHGLPFARYTEKRHKSLFTVFLRLQNGRQQALTLARRCFLGHMALSVFLPWPRQS
jgi:hypothetical protein